MVDGHLLTTQELNATEHQVIFKRIGEYATDVLFHHIHIPVNLQQQMGIGSQAMSIIQKFANNVYEESLMHYNEDNPYPDQPTAVRYAKLIANQNQFVVNVSSSELATIQNDLNSTITALPKSSSRISKRQLGFLFGLGSFAFATANALRIESIQQNVYSNKQALTSLTHIAEIQEDHLQHLDLRVQTHEQTTFNALRYNPAIIATAANEVVLKTASIAHKIQATIQQAQNHKLSTELLSGETITKIYEFIQTTAKDRGLQPLIYTTSDLFQIEMSYFYQANDKTLNLFLHVPLVQPSNLLHFFQLVPFPISNNLNNNLTMIPKLDKDLLAVGEKHQFQITSHADLQACEKYGTTYLCQGRHTTRTDLADTCLGAYYLEKWSVIPDLCQFQFIPAKEHVFKMAANKWIVSSPAPFSTTISCEKTFATVNLKQTTIITIPEGCQVILKTHVIHPDSYITETDSEVKHFNWIWNTSTMFPGYNLKAFNNTLNSLRGTSISIDYLNNQVSLRNDIVSESKEDVKELLHNISKNEHVHPNITFYISMIVFGTVAIILLFVILKQCNTRSSSSQDVDDKPNNTNAYSMPADDSYKHGDNFTPVYTQAAHYNHQEINNNYTNASLNPADDNYKHGESFTPSVHMQAAAHYNYQRNPY